mgnify:CR=1 FL=1
MRIGLDIDNVVTNFDKKILEEFYKEDKNKRNKGIAKYLDGTYSKGIEWLLDNYINNNEIPSQDEIENEFGLYEYDSYDYAYLMVSYLIDENGKDYLIELLKDKEKLNSEKEGLLNRSIDYYNTKYKKNGLRK